MTTREKHANDLQSKQECGGWMRTYISIVATIAFFALLYFAWHFMDNMVDVLKCGTRNQDVSLTSGDCMMHGNVYEWCLDRCTQALNGLADDMIAPKGIETDESSIIAARGRIVRGGSFHSNAAACASGQRRWDTENGTNSYYDYGFRLCLSL